MNDKYRFRWRENEGWRSIWRKGECAIPESHSLSVRYATRSTWESYERQEVRKRSAISDGEAWGLRVIPEGRRSSQSVQTRRKCRAFLNFHRISLNRASPLVVSRVLRRDEQCVEVNHCEYQEFSPNPKENDPQYRWPRRWRMYKWIRTTTTPPATCNRMTTSCSEQVGVHYARDSLCNAIFMSQLERRNTMKIIGGTSVSPSCWIYTLSENHILFHNIFNLIHHTHIR